MIANTKIAAIMRIAKFYSVLNIMKIEIQGKGIELPSAPIALNAFVGRNKIT